MKFFNRLFLLNWIVILATVTFFILKYNVFPLVNIFEWILIIFYALGIVFFIITYGALCVYSPKTKVGKCFFVLGLVQISSSIFVGIVWSLPYQREMESFSILFATTVAGISIPFAIATLVQRSKTKETR